MICKDFEETIQKMSEEIRNEIDRDIVNKIGWETKIEQGINFLNKIINVTSNFLDEYDQKYITKRIS